MSPPNASQPIIGSRGGADSSISSSSASVANTPLDTQLEGILVPEPETEVEVVQGNAAGQIDSVGAAGDEEAKKNLRDQLRRTLSHKPENSGKTDILMLL